MKHTPGPWTRVVAKDNSVSVTDDTSLDICSMSGNVNDGSNAKLVAAAPQMLDTLLALVFAIESFVPDPESWPELHAARSVIARATGEKP